MFGAFVRVTAVGFSRLTAISALTAISVLAAGAAVVAGAALVACGGEAAGEGYVGYWRAADVALADCTLLRVWEEGDAYLVRVDYDAPRPAAVTDGALRVEGATRPPASSGSGDAEGALASSCELVLRRGVLLLRGEAAASSLEVTLQPLAEAAYEEELTAMCDDRVRIEIMGLSAALHSWAEGHGGRTPAVPDLSADSEFARSLETLGEAWPTNPFTTDPMRAGSGPGDFTYSMAGSGFELVGYLSGGQVYSPE